jgi:hypothetical protein
MAQRTSRAIAASCGRREGPRLEGGHSSLIAHRTEALEINHHRAGATRWSRPSFANRELNEPPAAGRSCRKSTAATSKESLKPAAARTDRREARGSKRCCVRSPPRKVFGSLSLRGRSEICRVFLTAGGRFRRGLGPYFGSSRSPLRANRPSVSRSAPASISVGLKGTR